MADVDFGTALALGIEDFPLGRWTFATGNMAVALAIVRRLIQPYQGLTAISPTYGRSYGYNLVGLLARAMSTREMSQAQTSIADECMKEERVLRAVVGLVFTFARDALACTIDVTTAAGPFRLVLKVTSSDFTADFLKVA